MNLRIVLGIIGTITGLLMFVYRHQIAEHIIHALGATAS